MRQRLNTQLAQRGLLMVLTLALVAAACGSGADSTEVQRTTATEAPATTVADRAQPEETGFGDEPAAEQSADALGSGGSGTGALTTVDFGRDIIFTAEVVVAVSDVGAASTEATNAIRALGGFVFGQQTTGGGEARSTLTFKIAPENFQAALAALGTLGEVRTQSVTAQDVTDRVVDLQSRISTAEASVERLKEFLSNAGDIDTIAELESQLLDRETTLEVLRGQIRTLQDAVSLATITVTLTEALSNPQMEVQVTSYLGAEDSGVTCSGSEQGISVLENDTVTVCFEIFNVGDTLLTGFTLRDAVLDVDIDEMTVVWGDLSAHLEPGQSIVLSTEVTLSRSLRTQTRITAVPVNEDGQRVEAREVVSSRSIFLEARDPGGLPGFDDGVERSWDVLKDLGGLVVLVAGLLLPFIWVVAVYFIYRVWRRRRLPRIEASTATETPEE